MAQGLNVSGVVSVSVTLEPLAAPERNFGAPNVVTDSDIIDMAEGKRLYLSYEAVAQDHGTDSAAARAAALIFGQDPQPELCYVSRWAYTDTKGLLRGGRLSATQRALSNFTAVSSGSVKIAVDGVVKTLTGLDFSGALNLNAVAQIVQTALAATASGATVKWDSVLSRFAVSSGTTGTGSSVGYATNHTSGTAVAALLLLSEGAAAPPVPGYGAESLARCLARLADMDSREYAFLPSVIPAPGDAAIIEAAGVVEALSQSHMLGFTVNNGNVLDSAVTNDLASQIQDLGYKRTFLQYSSSNRFAAASLFGRAATVDFDGADTTITLMFKREPGIVAETITESQAATLRAKNCNVFVNYNNGTAILQHGVMANGFYFDEVHGLDWLQNDIQVSAYNLARGTPTKIPQTDPGMDMIKAVIKASCFRGVNNGLIAPGVWTGPKIGPIARGDVLTNGFYVHVPPVALQSEADRAERKSVSFQVLVKLAGAVHDIIINVYADR